MPVTALHHATSGNQMLHTTHDLREHKGTIPLVTETDGAVETKGFSMEG